MTVPQTDHPDDERPEGRSPLHHHLIVYQVERLRTTYADFRTSDRYQHLADFFFNDVYSTSDKSERNEQFRRLYETFRRRLGEEITSGVGGLVALNDMSDELDLELVSAMEPIVTDDVVDDDAYEEGYRRCDNYEARRKQIELLCESVQHFRGLATHRYIGLALKAVKAAARIFGGYTVIAFLDRGYHAYRSVTVEETDHFVEQLRTREMQRLDRIFRRREVADEAAERRKGL